MPDNDEIDLKRVFVLLLDYWYVFALSIGFCLICSYAYNWYTHPVYMMSATVLVSDEGNDISQGILDEVGMFGKKRNIENEITILSSRSLIVKAIDNLDLNIRYSVDLGLKKRDLYKNSPIILDYKLAGEYPESFLGNVVIDPNGTSATISWEWESLNGTEHELEQTIVLGESFTNTLGQFRLSPSSLFDKMVMGDSAVSKDYEIRYRSTDKLASHYLQLLTVQEAREKASILKLTLEDRNPERGVDILDAILNVFIQNNIEKKNQLASNSLQFIDGQLNVIMEDLSSLEGEIKAFKTSSGISDVSAEASFFLEQIGGLDKSISAINVKLSIIDYLESYVTSDKNLKNASPSSLGIDDPLLNVLIAQLSDLASEKEAMLKFTKEDNPLVASIDSKIDGAKAGLIKNIASIRSGLNASKAEINTQLSEVEKRVRNLPKAEYELLALQRQYSIKESLYLLLLAKKSENSIVLASTVSDNVVVDSARSSDEPVSPKKPIIYVFGLIAGIGLPCGYLLLLSMFDNRIKDKTDIQRVTSIPFLGIIPHNKESEYIVVADNTNSAIAESFRSIRTNISFLVREDTLKPGVSPKVLQVTSAMASEGKSFCSINLAASLALGGSKTIVVGLDLRKPKLAEYFNLSNSVGASSVLAGINTVEDAIVSTEVSNLDVMVAGPIPPNPSELLMGKSMSDMLDNLTQKYDHVVLDTPPIGLVTDSLIISEHAATTIYVVRQNVTYTPTLDYINDLYKSGKISSVSVLLNDVKKSKLGNGYGYGYGNGYYSDSAPQPTGINRIFRKFF